MNIPIFKKTCWTWSSASPMGMVSKCCLISLMSFAGRACTYSIHVYLLKHASHIIKSPFSCNDSHEFDLCRDLLFSVAHLFWEQDDERVYWGQVRFQRRSLLYPKQDHSPGLLLFRTFNWLGLDPDHPDLLYVPPAFYQLQLRIALLR